MTPLVTLQTALASLGTSKLRAGLTLLGVVIGVAAVIAAMSIGRGAQEQVSDQIEALGTNLLFVQPSNSDENALTLDDSVALLDKRYAPSIEAVAPEIRSAGFLRANGEVTRGIIVGVTSEYHKVRNFDVDSGDFISPVHVINNDAVVVLGSTIATTLFGSRDPVGAQLQMATSVGLSQFAIIGVLESKGGNAFGIEDRQVMVPLTTAHYRLSSSRSGLGDIAVTSLNVKVADIDKMDEANSEVATLLSLRHGEEDFTVTNQEDTIETLQSTESTFVILLGAIAGISLLVGGIGIMNIMMVSVTERIREIGVRKAMGARRRDIAAQFLSEATFLSIGGGLVGVALGLGLSSLIDGMTISGDQLATVFSGDIAILALVVSAGVGLFFGIYPAVRAARLHPIEALRHE